MKKKGTLNLIFWHNDMKKISGNKPLLVTSDGKALTFFLQQFDILIAQMEALIGV